VAQISWKYNLAVSAEQPAFFMNPLVGKTSTENYLQLNICGYYKAGNETNMAVMEVELPSGYLADVDALPSITRAKVVKRIDTANADSTVVIYFDRMTRNEVCLTVPAHRVYKVANHKPVPVTLYDYYDRSQAHRVFYEPLRARTCDICEGDDCTEGCNIVPSDESTLDAQKDSQDAGSQGKDAAISISPLFSPLILAPLLITLTQVILCSLVKSHQS